MGVVVTARLWLGPGHALYVGPPLGLAPHSGSVACLVVAVDGTFTVEVEASPVCEARSALIPARLKHQIRAAADKLVFCYFDPGSRRHRSCAATMTSSLGQFTQGHHHEEELASTAADLVDGNRVTAWLDLATGRQPSAPDDSGIPRAATVAPRLDLRIRNAVTALHDLPPQQDMSAGQLAALVGLSPSRFLHLFREHTGTSFRRYRLWLRMLRAAEHVRNGADLTTAAADAGFSSPSHFSDAFVSMFGLRPSRLIESDIRLL